MRNYIDLISEAPIGDIHRSGFDDPSAQSSFRPDDRGIIQSPKAEVKWRHLFRNSPYLIDVAFINTKSPTVYNDGVFDFEVINEYLGEYALPAPSSPDAIMLVLSNNEGANRFPLSGWIIAHRMGHAVAMNGGKELEERFENSYHILNDIVNQLYDGWEIPRLTSAFALGKMKSCRDRTLTSYIELIFELFAQFLITGKVSMNRLSKDTPFVRANGEKFIQDYPHNQGFNNIEYLNGTIESCEKQFQLLFTRILSDLKGRVIVL